MKKLIALILSAAVLVSLFSACGNVEPEVTTEAATEATTEATTEVTTEATTEVTTETEASTTEATTETTAETTAETAPPVDFASVWADAKENIFNIRIIDKTLAYDHGLFEMDVAYRLKGDETTEALLDTVSAAFSAPISDYSAEDAWWETKSPDFELSPTAEYSFALSLSESANENGSITLEPICYCETENGRYVFAPDEEVLEYLETFIEDARIKSFETYAESDFTEGESGENYVEIRQTNIVEGCKYVSVGDVQLILTSKNVALAEELDAVFAESELTPANEWVRRGRSFCITLSDGRLVSGICDITADGAVALNRIFFGDGSEMELYDLSDESREKLENLFEKIALYSAVN